jgi:apolipoprotein N-acyltransferase
MDSQVMMKSETRKPRAEPIPISDLASRIWPLALPSLATATLLLFCYYPLAWGWLAWVALVPFVALVRTRARARWVYLWAWITGLCFFGCALKWLRVADYRMYATWVALSLYVSLYFPAAIYLLRRFDQRTRLPLLITLPVVWTALEHARAHLLGGFAWYYLGHAQHQFLSVIQIADLGGAYAVSFVVAAVNALLFELLCSGSWFRTLFALPLQANRLSRVALIVQSALVVFLVAGTLAYGVWRLSQHDFEDGPRLALLQGNLDQRLRNQAFSPEGSKQALRQVVRHYWDLSDEAARRRPDLIVWPETSYPFHWEEVSLDLPPGSIPEEWQKANSYREELADDVASRWKTNVLLGANSDTLGADEQLRHGNSAILVRPKGRRGESVARYEKIHCIPFGEYVPFRESLPWMKAFAPYDFDYSLTPGKEQTRFPLGNYRFGVLICYEDTDPGLARNYANPEEGPLVDFLVNMSNDGWFDGTSEHEEHLAICRFRAVECRRAVARAVNMGISAVIDSNGRVIALPNPDWAKSKKVEAVVTAAVPIDRRASFYARWGDWLPWTCWLVVLGGWIGPFLWRAR